MGDRGRRPRHGTGADDGAGVVKKTRKTLAHVVRVLEALVETVDTLKGKVAAIQADVDAIKAKPAPVVVATQDDLDAIGVGLDAVSADLAPLK